LWQQELEQYYQNIIKFCGQKQFIELEDRVALYTEVEKILIADNFYRIELATQGTS
jgi:hypothetical protein